MVRGTCDALHLPPDPPAALVWAVTAYNITDGPMIEAVTVRSIYGSLLRGLPTALHLTGFRLWVVAISWWRCGFTAQARHFSTRPGSWTM
jgi:hypothetical protein